MVDGAAMAAGLHQVANLEQGVAHPRIALAGAAELAKAPIGFERSVRVDELALGKIAVSDWTGFVRSASALESGASALDRLLSVSQLQTDAGAGETLEPYGQLVR